VAIVIFITTAFASAQSVSPQKLVLFSVLVSL
jgi:hypothetical protein